MLLLIILLAVLLSSWLIYRYWKRRSSAESRHPTENTPPDQPAELNRAIAHREAGRYREAAQAIQNRLAGNPQDAGAYALLAQVLSLDKQDEPAWAALNTALSLNPAPDIVQRNHARLLLKLGKPELALQAAQTAYQGAPANPENQLVLAAALRVNGRDEEALPLVESALQSHPDYAEAYANRALLKMRANDTAGALADAEKALSLKPQMGQLWGTVGMLRYGFKNLAGAIEALEKALADEPDNLGHMVTLGEFKRQAGAAVAAIALLEKAVSIAPDNAAAWINLGAALQGAKRTAEAKAAYVKALEIAPGQAIVANNLGALSNEENSWEEALRHFDQALEIKPDYAEAHNNLGVALRALGRLDEAVASYRRALSIKPDFAEAHSNLGGTLQMMGRLAEAQASCLRALELKPDSAETHSNLGITLKALGQLDGAVASFRRALAVNPDYAEVYSNLGIALKDLGQLDDAVASYRRALSIKPDYAEGHSNLGTALQDLGLIDDAAASYRRSLELKPEYAEAHSNLLFALNYHPDMSGEAIFAAYREYDQHYGLPHRGKWRDHGNNREANRRLKVGYVSPDFRRQACQHFLEPLLAHHDKTQVEVYAYAELSREDGVTARYKGYADHWVPTVGMSDDALSERIRSDGIDILVDVAGHTAKNRLAVFARKPAPVSLSWLGFGYTTGLTAVDYLLTDAASAPEGSEGLFSETPWRVETPNYVYRPAEGMGRVSPLPALSRGHITFGTLTRAVRINHRTIRVWSEILKRVEGARLVIDSSNFPSAAMQDALAEKFAAHGVARERLEIGFHSPPWDVLRGLDIGLDCFPHNSGTTLFETLYMGLPFVTLAGRPSVGRLGSSILEGVGHPEWIARSEDEYVEIAAALASDLPKLAALRGGLRQEMETGPLMDEAGFARKVEAAYREMFGIWAKNGGVK